MTSRAGSSLRRTPRSKVRCILNFKRHVKSFVQKRSFITKWDETIITLRKESYEQLCFSENIYDIFKKSEQLKSLVQLYVQDTFRKGELCDISKRKCVSSTSLLVKNRTREVYHSVDEQRPMLAWCEVQFHAVPRNEPKTTVSHCGSSHFGSSILCSSVS